MRKMCIFTTLLALAGTQLVANDYSNGAGNVNGYQQQQQQQYYCAQPRSCAQYEISADWLFWNTRKCGLDYLWPADINRYDTVCGDLSTTPAPFIEGTVVTLGKGKPKKIDLDYDSGFRLAGYSLCNDTKVGARYTYYKTDKDDKHTIHGNQDIPYTPSREHPDIKGFVDGINVDFAKSHFDLELQVVEIEAGRVWKNCGSSFGFFGGIQAAFIDQEMRTFYQGTSVPFGETSSPEVEPRFHTVKEQADLDAYGLYIGGEGRFGYNCMYVFGRASSAALLGEFDRKFVEREFTDPAITDPNFDDQRLVCVRDSEWGTLQHYEVAVGVGYETTCNSTDYAFEVGYEIHHWTDMRNFLQFVDHFEHGAVNRSTDALGFDGIFVKASASF